MFFPLHLPELRKESASFCAASPFFFSSFPNLSDLNFPPKLLPWHEFKFNKPFFSISYLPRFCTDPSSAKTHLCFLVAALAAMYGPFFYVPVLSPQTAALANRASWVLAHLPPSCVA